MRKGYWLILTILLAAAWYGCGSEPSPVIVNAPPSSGSTPDDGYGAYTWAIGPIEGLTTVWHPTPREISVPVGTVVTLKCGGSPGTAITWNGANETEGKDGESIATFRVTAAGRHEVSVDVATPHDGGGDRKGDRPQGTSTLHTCIINGVDLKIDDIHIVASRPSVTPLGLDENATNEETMNAFFGGGERFQLVSQLQQIGKDHYATAVDRRVTLDSRIDPPVFASLIEYRMEGKRPWIGSNPIVIGDVGPHRISVGPPSGARELTLDTYRVVVTGNSAGFIVPDNEPVTFTAKTIPTGFEDNITWISSTKYGTATPVTGRGASFTVTFGFTAGPHPTEPHTAWRWIGARADNAIFNFDTKGRMGGSCETGIWEFVGRPASMPPNGALHLHEPLPCGALPPVSMVGPYRVSMPISGATVEHYPVTGNNLQEACQNIFSTTGPVDPSDNRHHAGSTVLE